MGRIIIYDEHVQELLHTLTKRKKFETGLLIGQSIIQKDIIVHACVTPLEDGENNEIPKVEKEQKKGKQAKHKLELENKINENWICQHAKQVTRMLPGGLDVVGIFIIANQEELNKLQSKLKQMLLAVYKILSTDQKLSINNENTEKIVLEINAITQKYSCRTYNISDHMSSAKPAEWKQHSGMFQWHKLHTQFSLDFRIPVHEDSVTHSLLKQIEVGLKPFFVTTDQAVALICGKLRKDDELLDLSIEGKKGKHANKTSQQCFTIDLFMPLKLNNNNITSPEIKECCAVMTIKGTIQCRAYIHNRGTVKEAIQVIKQDIIRSITSRCEIQCEDLLLIDEEQQDPQIVHELPRRVFAPLPHGNLSVCDYIFHGDSPKDSLEAFQELLNLSLTEDDVEITFEKTPDTLQLFHPQSEKIGFVSTENKSKTNSFLVPLITATVAVLAAGVSYIVIQNL